MIPLRVALVHRDHPRHAERRMVGMWAYDVPQLDVTHIAIPKIAELDRSDFDEFDVVFWEDARTLVTWTGESTTPLVYYVGDSTLTHGHFEHRYMQSRQADLIMVDWDGLDRFAHDNVPVLRLPYCVNDRMFIPRKKTVDVGFYASTTGERSELHDWLKSFCEQRGYSFSGGRREANEYVEAIASTRANVNLNRNPETRAHRCYDVMCCASALVTSPMPPVSGEEWIAGLHYWDWRTLGQLETLLDWLIGEGHWEATAARAKWHAEQHTWAKRAEQLHALLTTFLQERTRHAVVH